MSLANVPAACQSAITPLSKIATDCNLLPKGDLTADMDLKAFSNVTAAQASCVCSDANVKVFSTFLSSCATTLNLTATDVTNVGAALNGECAKAKGTTDTKKSSAQVVVFGGLASVLAAFAFI
ncbi:hypothetical protein HDU81_010567 [Chytriomyces hyalinus]|nr:hypothetical protein HDU81_010567 [Chytriomyces hyalinus]